MRVLITGGNGFLGSNLIEHFLHFGHQVFVISRNSNNITEYLNDIKFERYETNDYFSHEQSILDFNPNAVIHLAWEGGNSYSDANHVNQIYKNIPAGMSLLEIIDKQVKKPKFVGCGSFLEYGSVYNKATEYMTENPTSFYGLSKLFFKRCSEMYCKQKSIKWAWIRPCYIYGKRDVNTRLVPSVINKLLNAQDLLLDDCLITIDYLHVEDFCSAVTKIAESDVTGPFNVCSGEEQSLRDIVSMIREKIDPNIKMVFDASLNRSLKPRYICGSNERLMSLTGWTPKIGMSEGVSKTIEYHKLQSQR